MESLDVVPAATAIDCVAETTDWEVLPVFATEFSLLHEDKKRIKENKERIIILPEFFVFIL